MDCQLDELEALLAKLDRIGFLMKPVEEAASTIRAQAEEIARMKEALKVARWYAAFYCAAKHRSEPHHPSDHQNAADLTAIDAALGGAS